MKKPRGTHLMRLGHAVRSIHPNEIEAGRMTEQQGAYEATPTALNPQPAHATEFTKTKDKYRGYRQPAFHDHVIGTPQTPVDGDDGSL